MLSPWLYQLKRTRPLCKIDSDEDADLLIVGGGIAGLTTAYQILRYTRRSLILLEATQVAQGASGHNAGQMVAYFERSFKSLVDEFGLQMAGRAQAAVLEGWDLFEDMVRFLNLKTPYTTFVGYSGYSDDDAIFQVLEDHALQQEAGLLREPILVASNWAGLAQLPDRYRPLIAEVPHGMILEKLQTSQAIYHAAVAAKRGVTNSAMLAEELADLLLKRYPQRFRLFEHSPVSELKLHSNRALATVKDQFEVRARRAILCTNGFEHIRLSSSSGAKVDLAYHEMIEGLVGYMSGFLQDHGEGQGAITYHENRPDLLLPQFGESGVLPEHEKKVGELPYFYLTRRDYEGQSLVCLGGPELPLPEKVFYDRDAHLFPDDAKKTMDGFLRRNYQFAPRGAIDYRFHWHGLMGYTPTGVRVVGPDPHHSVLLYNLGCNGVGILPSFYGAKRVRQFLTHRELKPMIFDPVYSR